MRPLLLILLTLAALSAQDKRPDREPEGKSIGCRGGRLEVVAYCASGIPFHVYCDRDARPVARCGMPPPTPEVGR